MGLAGTYLLTSCGSAWQMARILNPELASFYEAYYTAKGIKLCKGPLAKEFKGDGKVRGGGGGGREREGGRGGGGRGGGGRDRGRGRERAREGVRVRGERGAEGKG